MSVVRVEDAGYGIIRPHDDNYSDAMITAQRGIMLCIHTADCVPVVLLDPIKRVAGVVHSGWVGSSKRIAAKMVRKMVDEYKSRPEDMICAIGPYNHSCCYEVREDVRERFRESFSDMECEMLFKKMNDEGCCTYHTSIFSSWRRTGDRKNRC